LYPIDNKIEIDFIDTPARLESFCKQIEGSEWLAIDTEFLRENTYFPKFCLLQVANIDLVGCIDPLAIADLSPLFEILYNPRITKVLHSGRQDLEIFFNIRGYPPSPVFDTQLAAPLLGYVDQISYGALVSEVLGVDLGKAHTRTDWSKRPLSPAQLNYAGDDVFYLAQVFLKMRAHLSSLGRIDWLADDFAALLDPENYNNPPEEAWRRIRGSQTLNLQSVSILQSLADWRERVALRSNLPRNWIIKDDILLSIARMNPSHEVELKTLRGLHERTLKRYGKQILERVEKARTSPPPVAELHTKAVRKSSQHEVLINVLIGVVHHIALENSLNASTLAPKKDLDLLVAGNFDNKLLRGWRKAIAGDKLLSILEGETMLSIRDGGLHLEPKNIILPAHRAS
jgi:ribonuclease D